MVKVHSGSVILFRLFSKGIAGWMRGWCVRLGIVARFVFGRIVDWWYPTDGDISKVIFSGVKQACIGLR
jgi:hypothetical protein